MLGGGRSVTVLASTEPTDMRKSFDGLSAIVRARLGSDPMSGTLYLFVSRDRRRAKVLLWDGIVRLRQAARAGALHRAVELRGWRGGAADGERAWVAARRHGAGGTSAAEPGAVRVGGGRGGAMTSGRILRDSIEARYSVIIMVAFFSDFR
jgi:IS66 Orf2 like protein